MRSRRTQLVAATAVQPVDAGAVVTVYEVTSRPPESSGGPHAIPAVRSPALAETPVGAEGKLRGVATSEAAEATLVPETLELLEQRHVLITPGVSFNVPYRNHFRITNLPDSQTLTRGVGLALSTTMIGLCIAIPALVGANWLGRRVEVLSSRLDVLVEGLEKNQR